MIRFAFFCDWDIFHYWPFSKVPWNQHNKSGYITGDGNLIYPFMWWIRRVPMKGKQLGKRAKVIQMPDDYPDRPAMERFFSENALNPDLF